MQKYKILNTNVVRRVMILALIVMVIGVVVLWLAFQHKPGWYQPVRLDDAGKKLARKEVTNYFDSIGDQLVQGKPFELILPQRLVNEWLALLPDVLPGRDSSESGRITEPVVRFEDGLIRIGAHYEKGGIHTILGVTLTASVIAEGRETELAIAGIQGGSLPAPKSVVEPLIHQLLKQIRTRTGRGKEGHSFAASMLSHIESAKDLFEGVKNKNRFIWPNGERLFQIDSITIRDGEIQLRIHPL